jgi:S-DNA-T family DNA segregation ATPase FtsK/SpoIIIE
MAQTKKVSSRKTYQARSTKNTRRAKSSPSLLYLVIKHFVSKIFLLKKIPRDVLSILFFALGLFLILILVGVPTGPGGRFIGNVIRYSIGWTWIILVLFLILSAIFLLFQNLKQQYLRFVICCLLEIASLSALADGISGGLSFTSSANAIKASGGYLGIFLGRPVEILFGNLGLYIIYVALLLVGLVLLGSDEIRKIAGAFKNKNLTKSTVKAAYKKKDSTSNNAMELKESTQNLEFDDDTNTKEEQILLHKTETDNQPEQNVTQLEDEVTSVVAQQKLPFGKNGVGQSAWKKPPVSLLVKSKAVKDLNENAANQGRQLVQSLQSHGVETKLIGYSVGPTVTRFELELAAGVKVGRVLGLTKDIAYAMAAPDVRILAPIPGKSAIGVEVPNNKRQLVTLGDVFVSNDLKKYEHPLAIPFGKDIAGKTYVATLAEMPHLLIAGATGSGKSSCINSLICSLLMRDTPDQLRFILIDPKRVELGGYSMIPHLLTDVVVDPKKAAKALNWAVKEMEKRYQLLAEVGARDISDYNLFVNQAKENDPGCELSSLYYIVVIVDELNDLMMVSPREVEDAICRIAQMARAVGIHLVIATQRPSVDVITGVIKANIPSRLAFSVSSLADSRVILDQPGAERLIGKGDMLLLTASSSVPIRLQAPWISQSEISLLVAFWRRQQSLNESTIDYETQVSADEQLEDDELTQAAMDLVIEAQQGSTTMLQRKLRIGFARAGRLMDILEKKGVVSPPDGSRARHVLISKEEYEEIKKRRAT